jgi:hypothetical protein
MDAITWIKIILVLIGGFLLLDWFWKKVHTTVYINQKTGEVTNKDGKVIGKVVDGKIEYYHNWWK